MHNYCLLFFISNVMPQPEQRLEQSYDDIADTIDEFQDTQVEQQCMVGSAESDGTCATHVTVPQQVTQQQVPQPVPQKGLTAWLLHMRNKQAQSQRRNTLVEVANTIGHQ